MNACKKNIQLRPHRFVLLERATGIARDRFDANPDGSLPTENIASLLATYCLLRDKKPEDFELMVLPKQSLLECVGERVQQLLMAGLTIGKARMITPREQEVLAGVVQKLANKEIATKLKVSVRTVKFHVSSLLSKFDVDDRVELGREAEFGHIQDANAVGEATDQTFFGCPVKISDERGVNANRPHQKEPIRTNHRRHVHALGSAPRDRFAN
jgi:DNA-binding CsgD family transcriptional regulator